MILYHLVSKCIEEKGNLSNITGYHGGQSFIFKPFHWAKQQLKTMATRPKFEVKSVQSKITTKNWHQCFRDFCEKWITVICVVCLDTSFTSLSGILPNGNSGNAELSVKEGFEQSTSAFIMLISLCWATEMRDSALNCAIYDLRNPFDIVTSSWFRADLSLTDSTTTTSGVSLVWSDIHCLRYVPNQDALGLFLPFSKKNMIMHYSYTNHIHQKYDYALVRTHNKRNWKPDLRKHIITLNLSMILPLFTRNFSQWMASVNFFIRTSKQ